MAAACGNDLHVIIGTPEAPSTSGFVEVIDDDDDGAELEVVLKHLHPPESLQPELKHYVVWLAGPTGAPIRMGVLAYDQDAREGKLPITSTTRIFTITVTAETSEKPAKPDGLLVAEQEILLDE